tara:strand:+ start:207 stop:1268 length:1062 start_codon:yes stop_codon:yes gene_type:complete
MATEDNNKIGATITYDSQHALDVARAYKEQLSRQLGHKLSNRPYSAAEQKRNAIGTKLTAATQAKRALPQDYSASFPAGVNSGSGGGVNTDSFLKKPSDDYKGWHHDNPVNMTGSLDDDTWVRGAYRSLLGREADDGGLAYWKGALASGQSRDDVVANFRRQPEYRDKFIGEAYRNLLGRDADVGGNDYWSKAMESGESEDQIIAHIKRSDEFGRKQQTSMRDSITPKSATQLLNETYNEKIATLGRSYQTAQDKVQKSFGTPQDYSPLLTTDRTIYTQDPEASQLASVNYLATQDPSKGSPSIWTQALKDAGANALQNIDIPGVVSGFFNSRKPSKDYGQMLDNYTKSLPTL